MKQIYRIEALFIVAITVLTIGIVFNKRSEPVIEPPRAWTDAEYELNGRCSYLIGGELDKCKEYFNIN